MKLNTDRAARALLLIAGSLSLIQTAWAGTPVFVSTNRDLLLCFRKTGATGGSAGPNDLQVNIGQASLYYSAAPGATITLTPFSGLQISAAFDDLSDLSWSVGGCVPTVGDTGDPSVPTRTLWITAPRYDPSIPATPWVRNSPSTQGSTVSQLKSVSDNAKFYSGTVAASSANTTTEVVVPVGGNHEYGYFVGAFGNYQNTFQGNVENTTPSTFITGSSPSRSDLYELRPDSTGTQPAGKYLGYFELRNNGTVVFVAASTSTAPPAPLLSISVNNNLSTISFPTTVGATYTLYYTNAIGLTTPTANWPSLSTNIIGDGTSKSFRVSTTGLSQFYRVQAH
jgi:hypothetical protein